MNSRLRPVVVVLLTLVSAALHAQSPLTLAEAERLALSRAVEVEQAQLQAQALRDQSVADGQLPDPALSLGVMSLPVDSFSRSAEPMTQLSVGVSQAFPPGATLAHQAARTGHLASAEDALALLRAREIRRDVREAYLEYGYQQAALAVVGETQGVLADILAVSKSLYRVGKSTLQDVLSAQLEQSLLDDREREVSAQRDAALAALQRWTGPLAAAPTFSLSTTELPAPPPLDQLHAQLEQHPQLLAAGARVAAGQSSVEAAREQYKPGWMLNVSYGERSGYDPSGMRRSDMLTAMVSVDLPVFTGKRQDRRLAASVGETDALRLERDAAYRDLLRNIDAEYPRWQRLQEREQGYAERILPAARHNAEAALTAYRNGVTDFTALMRATQAELDSRLQALRTTTERLQSQARLNFYAGDEQ